jgi:transketolase
MKPEKKMGLPTRDAYGQALVEVGRANPKVVVLDGDVSGSTKSRAFAKEFPDRFFNFGIAEANMVSAAAGFASCGKIPFASSFAAFLMCKAFEQLRMSVVNPYLNVKLCGSHSGISLGEDGASQMAIEDIALALALPKVVVLSPVDEVATRALVKQAAEHAGPVYLRTGRPKSPIVYPEGEEGRDVTVMATGLLVWEAIEAAWRCHEKGIDVRVMDIHTIRPLDEGAILEAAQDTGAVVTAEEHLINSGLGAQVAQLVAQHHPTPMEFVGIRDSYAESGKPAELFERYGLTSQHIVSAIEQVLKKKK